MVDIFGEKIFTREKLSGKFGKSFLFKTQSYNSNSGTKPLAETVRADWCGGCS
jgi:hypothetical protein